MQLVASLSVRLERFLDSWKVKIWAVCVFVIRLSFVIGVWWFVGWIYFWKVWYGCRGSQDLHG
jgi:hypothetical protein